ncbi:MAG: hypothetical protein FJ297_12825 [Planctomycetes bacterium]|nr:hypothetical protein [Planctomycetota bacterium]
MTQTGHHAIRERTRFAIGDQRQADQQERNQEDRQEPLGTSSMESAEHLKQEHGYDAVPEESRNELDDQEDRAKDAQTALTPDGGF